MMRQQFGTRLAQSFLFHAIMLLAVSILLLMTATPLGSATVLSWSNEHPECNVLSNDQLATRRLVLVSIDHSPQRPHE
jgi:hypothetical protein